LQGKKYANPFTGKAKLLAIISIVLTIAVSYGIFSYLENSSEQNVRNSIFEQQRQNQLKDTEALSRHVGTDLSLVVDNLRGLANSIYIQQGDLSSNKTKGLAQETYNHLSNSIIDRLVIADKSGLETIGLAAKGQQSFAGTNISSRPWVKETMASKTFTFSNGFVGLDGKYRVAIGFHIRNLENGQYEGLVGALIPFESFLSQYGNVYNINSEYLTAYDKKATILATATSQSLIGKSFFGDYSQQFIKHNKVLTDFVRNLLAGTPGYAIYNYGDGEKLTTGYPIFADGKPVYFIRLITPTAGIYSHINDVLFTERLKMFSLIAGTTAAIAILIVFLIKWNSLNDKVKKSAKELGESNKQLKLANEQLKVHDKMQKEFINIASHEMKTPTQSILSYSELMQRHPERREEMVQAISRNATRLQRLTNDILDVTRIESQSLKLNKKRFILNDLISIIVDDYMNQIRNSNVKIVQEFNEKAEVQGQDQQIIQDNRIIVEADKERITQVISNILHNAVMFTKEGSISVSIEKKDRQAIVIVKDTGEGIDSGVLPKLFTKFITRSEKGTGLGLFISKSIIESHGGKIWAENNTDGKGATFAFSLPLSEQQ
jgi:signal transduction histidine kinase